MGRKPTGFKRELGEKGWGTEVEFLFPMRKEKWKGESEVERGTEKLGEFVAEAMSSVRQKVKQSIGRCGGQAKEFFLNPVRCGPTLSKACPAARLAFVNLGLTSLGTGTEKLD